MMTTEAAAALIGERVHSERQSRGWTLDELAERSGLSRRVVINVEHGSTNPNVGTLLKLASVFGLGLSALVESGSEQAEPSLHVTRAGDGRELWTGRDGSVGVLVASALVPDMVELWEWTLAPGERHTSEPHRAGTIELIHVRSGSLIVESGSASVELAPGDAVSFAGDVQHGYATKGRARATFTLTVYEPVPSARRAASHGAGHETGAQGTGAQGTGVNQ